MDSSTSVGMHLGVPIDIQDTKVRHFTPLLDKITLKISQWAHFDISQSSKIIIINAILIGLIRHYLSILRIPETILSKIDRLMAIFFWKDRHGKGIPWKNRELLHRHQNIGGLGIRNVGLLILRSL